MDLIAYLAEYTATPARRRTLKIVAANAVFFAALVAVMFYVRGTSHNWPETPTFEFGNLLMAFTMGMSAACGSITMVVGAHSAAKGKNEEAVRWVAIAVSSWMIFLFLELVEWVYVVYLAGMGPKTPFGATFLLLTGAHWLAVIGCGIWFTFVVADVRRRDILAAALYSHFLVLWWIVIVIVVYLPNLNPLADL